MAITDILAAAQGGRYYANAASACGLSETEARRAIDHFAPDIAARLKAKAASDTEAFEALLDLLEEGGDSSDLNDADAMTCSEAQSDGAAILDEVYGSKAAAMKALGAGSAGEEKAAALSATAVMAALAASNAVSLSSQPQQAAGSGGGLVSITATAKGRIRRVQIDESLLQPSEKQMLEDLVAAAINDARGKADQASNEEMAKMSQGMPLPPGFKLPFG